MVTQLKPVRTSDRSFVQIVADWEDTNPQFFFEPVLRSHEDCRCDQCFQKKLDAILAIGEALNDNPSDPVGCVNSDQL